MALLIGGPIDENLATAAAASPVTHVTADDPPFLIVHGTRDPVVAFDQSMTLHAALTNVQATSTLLTVDGGGHGAGFGPDVTAVVTRFFDHHLRGKKSTWRDQTIKAASF